MSTYTHYITDTSYAGDTLYAKAEPVDWSDWAAGRVAITGDGNGSFSAVVDSATQYAICRQLGGSPADTDESVGSIMPPAATPADVQTALGDVPTATEISDRIERVGGPLDLLENSALTGPNTVTVTVTDSVSSGAIQSAKVKVFRTGEFESKLTNGSGVTSHGLTSNTFVFTTNARGYASDVQTVVVSGDQPVAVSLTPITIADSGTPGVCRLIAYVFLNDSAVVGATVSARLKSINQATDGIVQSVIAADATTDANGLATIDLIQGGEFANGDGTYVITATHNRKVIWQIESAMPDAASVNVEDLLTP